ncbi:MAG TPA: hypothetical protein VF618_05150 [Thermoanaerobaculia bacterium]
MSKISITRPAVSVDPSTVTLTPEAMIEQLRAMRAQVPEFTHIETPDARSLQRVASLSPELLAMAVAAIGDSALMELVIGQPAANLQQDQDDAARWLAVEEELRRLLKGLSAANLIRRYRVGLAALRTYNIGRQLVRNGEHRELVPHVEKMTRLLALGQRPKKDPAPQTATKVAA